MASEFIRFPSSSGQTFDTGAGPTTANTLRTVIVTDQTPIPVTISGGALDFGPSAAAERVAALLGNTTGQANFGAGATTGQTLRAVLVTDQTAIPASQSGSWTVAVSNFPGTQPVSGTVTANQGTAGASAWLVDGSGVIQPVSGTVTADQGGAWSVAVNNFPATQPVSGTVTANQGGAWTVAATQSGTWNITNITGTVSLPTGASTSALQTTGNTSLASIDSKTPALGQAAMAASVPVAIASDQSPVPVTTGTANLAYSDEGSLDFSTITNTYQTVLATTAAVHVLFVFNNMDQPIDISINGGSTTGFLLQPNQSFALDLATNGLGIPSGVNLQAKYASSAPTMGVVSISVVG